MLKLISGVNTTGLVMWIIVAAAMVLVLVYMVFNIMRMRKEKKAEMAKPRLIISTGYTKSGR